jgi:hypothetical protein
MRSVPGLIVRSTLLVGRSAAVYRSQRSSREGSISLGLSYCMKNPNNAKRERVFVTCVTRVPVKLPAFHVLLLLVPSLKVLQTVLLRSHCLRSRR